MIKNYLSNQTNCSSDNINFFGLGEMIPSYELILDFFGVEELFSI